MKDRTMPYLDPLDVPDLTEDGLFEYLHSDEGVKALTRNAIKWAVLRQEIIPTRIGKSNMYTRRDALNWLASRKGYQPPTSQTALRQMV